MAVNLEAHLPPELLMRYSPAAVKRAFHWAANAAIRAAKAGLSQDMLSSLPRGALKQRLLAFLMRGTGAPTQRGKLWLGLNAIAITEANSSIGPRGLTTQRASYPNGFYRQKNGKKIAYQRLGQARLPIAPIREEVDTAAVDKAFNNAVRTLGHVFDLKFAQYLSEMEMSQ
jgi:hypothetical protein